MIAPPTLLLRASASTTTTTTMKPMTTQSNGNSSRHARRSNAFESAVEAVLRAAAAARTFVTNAFERLVSSISQVLTPSHTHTTACDKAAAPPAPPLSTAELSGNVTPTIIASGAPRASIGATSSATSRTRIHASIEFNPGSSPTIRISYRAVSSANVSANFSAGIPTSTAPSSATANSGASLSPTTEQLTSPIAAPRGTGTSILTSIVSRTPNQRPTPTRTRLPQSLQSRPWSGGPVDERLYITNMPSMVLPLPDRDFNARTYQRLAQRVGLTRVRGFGFALQAIEHPLTAADRMRRAAARHVPHDDPPMYACTCSHCPDDTAAYMLCAAATIRRTMCRLGSRVTTSVIGVTARRQSLIACHARSTSYPRFAR